jgi:hypothetical protein
MISNIVEIYVLCFCKNQMVILRRQSPRKNKTTCHIAGWSHQTKKCHDFMSGWVLNHCNKTAIRKSSAKMRVKRQYHDIFYPMVLLHRLLLVFWLMSFTVFEFGIPRPTYWHIAKWIYSLRTYGAMSLTKIIIFASWQAAFSWGLRPQCMNMFDSKI